MNNVVVHVILVLSVPNKDFRFCMLELRWIRLCLNQGTDCGTSRPTGRYGAGIGLIGSTVFMFGGADDTEGFSQVFEMSSDGNWKLLCSTNGTECGSDTPLSRSFYGGLVPIKSSLYVFGGGHHSITDYNDYFVMNDLWEFTSERQWVSVCPELMTTCGVVKPSSRHYHSMAAVGSSLFLFGGWGSLGFLNDLWEIDLGGSANPQWIRRCLNGSASGCGIGPSRRYGHAMVSIGTTLYVFGGYDGGYPNDLWQISAGGNWSLVCSDGGLDCGVGPTGRWALSMVAVGSRLVVFGGFIGGQLAHDLWTIEPGGNWSQLCKRTSCGSVPLQRYIAASCVNDSSLLVFAGNGNIAPLDDFWKIGNICSVCALCRVLLRPLPNFQIVI